MTDISKESLLLHLPAIINNKHGEMSLFKSKLVWRYYDTVDKVTNTLMIMDIISIQDNCDFTLKNRLEQSPKIVNKNSDRLKKIRMVIYSIVCRTNKSSQLNIRSTIVFFDDENCCSKWKEAINDLLSQSNFECDRPKSLLVFINPIGGNKKGIEIYNSKVKPIFELAGIEVQVSITSKRDEAKEFIINGKFSKVDGFVCVGGDGTLMELIHGLLLKARLDAGHSDDEHKHNSPEFSSPLRVGIIPAGSTDSVAYSTIGTKDAITSALHIVKGSNIALDALTVYTNNKFLRYNISLMGYGFYGSCISESEALRWMGPKRYDWLGLKHWMSFTTYYGELKYLPGKQSSGDPRDGNVCKERCPNCSLTDDHNTTDSNIDERKDWVTVCDEFVAINSFLISCRCKKSPIGPAPYAHLGNGCSDLVIVRECNRFNFLRHLLKTATGDDHFNFDFVETVRVSEFSFTPLRNDNNISIDTTMLSRQFGVWNCDGEPIYTQRVQCKVHRKLIRLFASGIPDTLEVPGDGSPSNDNISKTKHNSQF